MSIIALYFLDKILGYVVSRSISFKMVGPDICCSVVVNVVVVFSSRLKYEVIRFFQLVFCFLCKFWIGGACAVWSYDLLHIFPDYHAYNTTNTICNPWTAWKGDRATKIIVTKLCYSMTDLKKDKFLLKLFYALLRYDVLCVVLISFLFPKKSRSTGPFFLTHPKVDSKLSKGGDIIFYIRISHNVLVEGEL